MKKHHRTILALSHDVAAKHGCTAKHYHTTKNKAYVLIVSSQGEQRKVFCAATPSDNRAMKNHLCNVKRVCIDLTQLAA